MSARNLLALVVSVATAACGNDSDGTAQNAGGAPGGGGHSGTGGSGATGASGGVGGFDAGGKGGAGGVAGTSATGGSGGTAANLCQPLPANLLAHGTFEEGMSGDAPAFWEVRDPGALANCAGSGTASQHVFLTAPAPGCSGQALAIDARGQWDCYAVQRVTDYNSIEGGATYRVSAAVRSQGNAVNHAAWFVLGVQWLDSNDQFFGDEKNPQTASAAENDYDWKILTFDLNAPANAKRMLVWLSAHYPGRVDFDNVSVAKQ